MVDLTDLDAFEAGRAWPLFDELLACAPLHRNDEPASQHGFWSLTRHADVVRVLRDQEFTSADRDERVFDEPYRVDVLRRRVDHLAFGKGGPHFCLGNQLARLELRIMLEELVPRLPEGLHRTGPVTRVRSNIVNGIKTFPVSIPVSLA